MLVVTRYVVPPVEAETCRAPVDGSSAFAGLIRRTLEGGVQEGPSVIAAGRDDGGAG